MKIFSSFFFLVPYFRGLHNFIIKIKNICFSCTGIKCCIHLICDVIRLYKTTSPSKLFSSDSITLLYEYIFLIAFDVLSIYSYSVMQSDGNNFSGDGVSDSFKKTSGQYFRTNIKKENMFAVLLWRFFLLIFFFTFSLF